MHLFCVCVYVCVWTEWGMSIASSNINNWLLFPEDAFSSHTRNKQHMPELSYGAVLRGPASLL